MLENCVLHADGMTRIDFRIKTEEAKAVFEIEDDGCGIPEEKISRLLNGYYEPTEEIADSKKKNAGIGLSVCATIIKAHGGEISAENTENGALFRFTLDIKENKNEQ